MNTLKSYLAVILALSGWFLIAQPARADKTLEQYYSAGAYQIHADDAWAKGYTGRGIVVGVIDSGIDAASGEFGTRILPGYNAIDGSADVTDQIGHGSHVSGIIGAAANGFGMIGVAPDVSLLPIKVFSSDSTSSGILENALNWSIGKARIINLSLGGNAPFGEAQFRQNVAAGQLLVIAAGNDGAANPDWPARYAKERWANGQLIAVGAVDGNNVIASFSNRAGDTRKFYVVAPGVNIVSTYPGARLNGWTGDYANYAIISGTSMAAPYVAGLAADIEGLWPQLNAKQAASIIFKTADHLGTSAVGTPDSVYGWGLVDAAKALAPIGTAKVPSKTGGASRITYNMLFGSRAAGSAFTRAAGEGAFRMVALDDFGRQYQYDFGAAVTKQDTMLQLSQLYAAMDSRLRLVDAELPGGAHLTATARENYGTHGQPQKMTSFAWTQPLAGGDEISIGTGNFASQFFGLSDTPFTTAGYASNPFDNPYLSLANAGSYVGYGYRMGGGWTLKAGLLSASDFASAAADDVSASRFPTSTALAVAQIEKPFENGKISLSMSSLQEGDAMLGGTSTGIFAMGSTTTLGMMAAGTYRIGPSTWLAGQASFGVSDTSGGAGLVSADSGIVTTAFSAGIMRKNAFRDHDSIGFYVSQPLKIVKGSLTMDKPVDVSVAGQVLYRSSRISLVPTASEVDFEANYATSLGSMSAISGAIMYRLNPGHEASNAAEAMLALRWGKEF